MRSLECVVDVPKSGAGPVLATKVADTSRDQFRGAGHAVLRALRMTHGWKQSNYLELSGR